jgi:hypothetical protein
MPEITVPPRQIAAFFSEVLTLGVVLGAGAGDAVLVDPGRDAAPGSRVG